MNFYSYDYNININTAEYQYSKTRQICNFGNKRVIRATVLLNTEKDLFRRKRAIRPVLVNFIKTLSIPSHQICKMFRKKSEQHMPGHAWLSALRKKKKNINSL